MSSHDEQITTHPLWESLAQLEAAIHGVEASSDGDRAVLERFATITRFATRWLERSEPALVKTATLDAANQQASAALSQVQSFASNGNSQHLTNAVAQMESVLTHAQQVWAAVDVEDVGSVRDDVSSFRKSASQHVNALSAEVDAVRAELRAVEAERDELRTEIEEQKGRLDAAIAEFQQQFSAAQESRSSEHDASRSQRSDEHAQAMKAATSAVEEIVEAARVSREAQVELFGDARSELVEKGGETLAELRGLRDEAAKVVGVVGNIGITGDYQKSAKQEKRQAFWWAVAALAFFIGAVVAAAYFLTVDTDGLGAAGTARRIALSLIVAAPATFCVSQSREHRTLERRNRSLELELASLDPFVAPLPAEYQQAMKAELAARYFRGTSSEPAELDTERWFERFRRTEGTAEES